MWIYLNDSFVSEKEAVISVFDHGFLYGDGVYETIRSYAERIFMCEHHLARLYRSAEAIGLTIPIPRRRWPDLLREAMRRNDVGNAERDAYVRITVSRGAGEIGLDPRLCPHPTVVIMTKPLLPFDPDFYESGVGLIVAQTRRNLPSALSPHIKATNFLNNILAKREAISAGVFDSILLNWEGLLAESTVSNLFFVQEGIVHTPSVECGLLDGITRDIVIQLARESGLSVVEGRFSVEQLLQADEGFLTNTSLEIMPVSHVNQQAIGSGKPGPITQQLRSAFGAQRGRFLE